jgi:hypothetical protein
MQIDRRFADYGLTGGFFLICQLGLLWALGYWPTINQLQALRPPSDTSLLAPIITGFAGALAVIAVFVAGLILDLLASLFRSLEMRIFARHLDRNSDWITVFIEAHKAYCGADYETFQRAFRELPRLAALGLGGAYLFTFWKRESRLRYAAAMKIGWGWGVVPQYERLSSFFTSYVMVHTGSAQLTFMADQYSLWRTARAIAIALYLFIFEAFIVPIIPGSKETPFVPWLAFLGLALIFLIIQGTYSRLCFTLFSLMYVACDRQSLSGKDAEPAR